jgi:23S rRNA pseudouridine2605 synthase
MSKFFRPGKPGGSSSNDKRGDGKPLNKKPFGRGSDKPTSRKEFDAWKNRSDSDAPKDADKSSDKPKSRFGDKPFKKSFDKPAGKRPFKRDEDKRGGDFKPKSDRPFTPGKESDQWRKRAPRKDDVEDFGAEDAGSDLKSRPSKSSPSFGRPFDAKKKYQSKKKFKKGTFGQQAEKAPSDLIRLNKYLANAGVSSRREADKLIESGVVTVNGKVITELGYKITPGDEVKFGGAILRKEKSVYILLNKPKDYITTSKDPQERRTVMHLIEGACKERVYPVGRLDRMTTGLLLFTNDGEVAKRLTHPSHGAKKMYHVTLDQNLSLADMKSIQKGIELEDGIAEVDAIEFVEGAGRKEVGIEIHSGRNRIVRRIFEKLGYNVIKLDRVTFAGLTKKDLQRGYWRQLSEKEIGMLLMTK